MFFPSSHLLLLLLSNFILLQMVSNLQKRDSNLGSQITFTTMIIGLCNGGLLKEAKELLAKMGEGEIASYPDEVAYNIIVQACLKGGEDADALMYLEEMDRRGFLLHASTFSNILDLLPSKAKDHILLKAIQKLNPIEKPASS